MKIVIKKLAENLYRFPCPRFNFSIEQYKRRYELHSEHHNVCMPYPVQCVYADSDACIVHIMKKLLVANHWIKESDSLELDARKRT